MIIGDNFFKIFNLHKDIQLTNTLKSQNTTEIKSLTEVSSEQNSPNKQHPACTICPNRETGDHCDQCLVVKDIYV